MFETEIKNLERFGVGKEVLEKFQILCLPENLEEATSKDELFDASNTVDLTKALKDKGVLCANSLELGLGSGVLDRRGAEFWFGLIYVLDKGVIPLLIGIIAGLISYEIISKCEKNVSEKNKSRAHLKLKIKEKSGFTSLKYDGEPKTLIKLLEGLIK